MVHKSSICTMSLGRCFAGHSLSHKLDMARKYGFHGIEVFYEDLVSLTYSMPGGTSQGNQLIAARVVRDLCRERGLEIICLQPFMHFGALRDRNAQKKQTEQVAFWIQLARATGTDLIVFPSSFLAPEKIINDIDLLAADLREVADLGLQETPSLRFAFESLCWGTHIDTWEAGWDLVQRINRPNFGVCLDTFNIAGRVYADPESSTGCTADAEQALITSMKTLVSTLDISKVFLVQVADAERLSSPLNENHELFNAEQPSRMSWSRNCRLFYGESSYGAYLPTKAILATIVRGLGYQGWLSFEVFNRRLTEKNTTIPEEMARRAVISWEKLAQDVPLQVEDAQSQHRVSAML